MFLLITHWDQWGILLLTHIVIMGVYSGQASVPLEYITSLQYFPRIYQVVICCKATESLRLQRSLICGLQPAVPSSVITVFCKLQRDSTTSLWNQGEVSLPHLIQATDSTIKVTFCVLQSFAKFCSCGLKPSHDSNQGSKWCASVTL